MRVGMLSVLVAVVALNVNTFGCGQNVSEKRAASPTMGERIKHDTVSGKVTDIGANHVSIKEASGETRRVHVDTATKMDHVVVGDHVKAYVTDSGHASTIQRDQP